MTCAGRSGRIRRDATARIRAMRQTYARYVLVLAILAVISAGPGAAVAARAQSLDREVEATLRSLYETTPGARELAPAARGILVFPDIFRENYYYTFESNPATERSSLGARSSATTRPARSRTDCRPAHCRSRPFFPDDRLRADPPRAQRRLGSRQGPPGRRPARRNTRDVDHGHSRGNDEGHLRDHGFPHHGPA